MADVFVSYDAEAMALRKALGASIVGMVVVGGDRGDGAAFQMVASDAETLIRAAGMLRGVAEQVEDGALRLSGMGAGAGARLVLEAGRTSLAMLAYGLGKLSAELTGAEMQAVLAATDLMKKAFDELARVLESAHKSRGEQ